MGRQIEIPQVTFVAGKAYHLDMGDVLSKGPCSICHQRVRRYRTRRVVADRRTACYRWPSRCLMRRNGIRARTGAASGSKDSYRNQIDDVQNKRFHHNCYPIMIYGTARSLGSDLPDAARMYAVRLYDTRRSCQPGQDSRCNDTTCNVFAPNSLHACAAESRCGNARSNPVCGN